MIVKPANQLPNQFEPPAPQDIDVPDTQNPEGLNPDGSLTIVLEREAKELPDGPFDQNLAEVLEDSVLTGISNDLMEAYEADEASRSDWKKTYTDGLDLLGIKMDDRTKPWPGACGVYHPILTEAVVRFEAQAIMEIFPPQGPAKTKIMGQETPDRVKQAQRIQEELNYILTEKMTDYRDETEALLFRLPLAGSAFRKVYYDQTWQRPAAKFVPAENLVVSYGESDIRCCGRVTYIDSISENELKRRQASGFYRKVELSDPPPVETTDIQDKENRLTGVKAPTPDDRYEILEFHVDYDIDQVQDSEDDIGLPYVISIEKSSKKVLAVYRNWREDDPLKAKRDYFVHYRYLPGLGFYGFGLIHVLGGLAKSATSILRQLVDAGTLSNLPGGLKSRGLRIKGDDSPIRPGEFRDVDVSSGAIKDSITFLPYKEPSAVLYQLLGNVVDEGRRVGSIADMEMGDLKQEAPVGTTLALMERALKVMSAVQARLHASLQQELRLIARVVKDYLPNQYEYDVGGQFDRRADFEGIQVIPVSDPGATTMSQRVVQYQAVIQLASQNPQIYDLRKLNYNMLNVLGIKDADQLVPDPANVKAADPVSENESILRGSPVKVFPWQDHEAHMQVHLAMLNDPKIQQLVSQSPQAGVLTQAMSAHITDHLAAAYRQGIEQQLGTPLPPEGQELPPELEVQISRLTAQAAPRLLQQHSNEQAAQEAQQQAQDPLVQLQQQDLAIKLTKVQQDGKIAQAKLTLDAAKMDQDAALSAAKLKSSVELNGAKLGSKIAEDHIARTTEQKTRILEAGLDVASKIATAKLNGKNRSSEPA